MSDESLAAGRRFVFFGDDHLVRAGLVMLAGRFVMAMVIAMRFVVMRVSARHGVAVFAVALLRAGKDVNRARMMLAQLILPARREDEKESHQSCKGDFHLSSVLSESVILRSS